MNAEPPDSGGTLPLDVADQIDRICDRYEQALSAGRAPTIESYLGEVTASARSALLRELLASELEWRRRRGERPTPTEYHARFPDHPVLIGAIFEATTAPGVRPTESRAGDPHPPLRVGACPLPEYRLVKLLGEGGFGQVWKAEGPGGVPVALKFVRLLDGPGGVELRAFETIKGIRHPNLLAPFGAWRVADLLIIGMELADGTLMERLQRAQARGRVGIPDSELIEYLAEAAKGVDYLNGHVHSLDGRSRVGVQHRDIKPQNILLFGGGVKVADFGLARLLDRSVASHTGSLTPAYAAPEFFHNQTSNRSDQYSLAVAYCQLRGGRLPFTGSTAAIMAGHLQFPPDLTMIPEAERPIVARALAKEPAERWPDCRTFVAALRATLGSDAPTRPMAAPAGPSHAVPTRGGTEPAFETPPPPTRPARRGRGRRAVVLLAITSALGLAFWGRGGFRNPLRDVSRVEKRRTATGDRGAVIPRSDPEEAAHDEDRAPAAEPERVALEPDPKEAARHKDRGNQLYDRGEYEQAVQAYGEAISRGLDDAEVYNNRGNAYLQLQGYDAAVADYDQAIRRDPDAWKPYFNRGNAHFNLRQYREAVRDYTASIERNSADPNSYKHRALAYDQLGESTKAERDRAEAGRLESDPDALPED